MSLKGDKYETVEEIKARLEGTIVMYDGKPVYITKAVGTEAGGEEGKEIARVFFQELPWLGNVRDENGGYGTRKFLSSRKFDLTPFKMGYMNKSGAAYFLARVPVRQYKQGLSGATLSISDVRGKKTGGFDFARLIRDQCFVDMINGKYPDFKAAGDMLGNEETSSVALSRNFAFQIDHDLEALVLIHRGVKCGLALKGEKGIKIPPKFHFLREEMEENRIPIL